MRLQLRGSRVDPEKQRKNDRHGALPVFAVLAVLALFAFMYTGVHGPLGLSSPEEVAKSLGVVKILDAACIPTSTLFDWRGLLRHPFEVREVDRLSSRDELLFLYALIGVSFLFVYFLPLPAKKAAMVFWFAIGFLIVFGLPFTCMFFLAHLLIYRVFHGTSPQRDGASFAAGGLAAVLFLNGTKCSAEEIAAAALATGVVALFSFRGLDRLLGSSPRVAQGIRRLAVFSPVLFCVSAAVWEGVLEDEWVLPVGFLFFLQQWNRLLIYFVDFKDGEVPPELSVTEYLAVFLAPGSLICYTASPYIGQGYSYLNECFLCEDKNRTVLRGVELWLIAAAFVVIKRPLEALLGNLIDARLGIPLYTGNYALGVAHVAGKPFGTATVLLSTLLYQLRVYMWWGAICHFRVGAWNVLGFRVDPQYNMPWLATNLVALWGRFAFHFRELLVRAFYYPVFFRFFKKNKTLRVFTATFAAAALGNLFWVKITSRLYTGRITWDHLVRIFQGWPYYLFLGLAISLTQVYLMRRGRTRKPWTWDRWFWLDIVCAYLSLQTFALIHIFARPVPGGSFWQQIRLFLLGCGIAL